MTEYQKKLAVLFMLLPCSTESAMSAIRYIVRKGLFFEHQNEQKVQYFRYQKKATDLSKEECSVLAFLASAKIVKDRHVKQMDASVGNPVIRIAKNKVKQNWLKDHAAVLRELRTQGYSYRMIAKIIEQRFRISISHTYVAEFFHQCNGGVVCSKKS